ncbi:MAG TPA: isoprenylcysteine carboxylmethyltransferase family protein [Rubrivivax sp.]|nr:isoprenylcysteine carboxylmethyltransferase family protein [Rubrivivax sp.]
MPPAESLNLRASFLDTRVPAPVVAALLGAAMKGYRLANEIGIDPTPLRMHLGITLSQVSVVVVLAALASLWRARTTINPLQPARATALVTGGAYRFTRNPMYLSLLLLLVAYAIRIDSFVVWLAPLVYVAYVTRFQILPEERVLQQKFGAAFEAYRARTRRWI